MFVKYLSAYCVLTIMGSLGVSGKESEPRDASEQLNVSSSFEYVISAF